MEDQYNLNNQTTRNLDRQRLKEIWMDFMQQLSGDLWTDYNAHDPGITFMEQFCDSMAKVNNRANTPIQNLLNSQSRKKREAINNAFYDAVEILPTNPVTQDDYRILMIDRIQYVKNAWVEPVRDNMQGIQGLYRVLLQIDENARTEQGIKRIKEEVFALFNQHRNLCEDMESIQVLDVEKIEVFADIDIRPDAIAEEVLADILFRLEEHLNPSVQFYTLEELTEQGYGVDEAFDGPPPVHGIIRKAELRNMTQEVYVSKLIEIIQDVKGVRRITYFRVDKNGIPIEGDIIPIRQHTYPVLDMDTIDERFLDNADYPLQFFRGALNYELDLNTANQLLYSLYARYKKGYHMKMLYHEKDFPSTITLKEVGRYDSLQNSLPITYGVNEMGLPDYVQATRDRLAMIKQLRGYLLLFEQTFSNYLAQLANVRRLFSIDKDIDKTYFTHTPDTLPGIYDLIFEPTVANLVNTNDYTLEEAQERALELFNEKVGEIMLQFDPFVDRRNRVLDHLLARFGERFSTDFLMKVSNYVGVGTDDETVNPERELINAKIDFLQHYVDISKNRGKGFDYLESTLDPWNVSGLEKRACLLLNINPAGHNSLMCAFKGHEDKDQDNFDPIYEVVDFVHKDTAEGVIRLDALYEIHQTFGIDESELDDELRDELDRLRTSLEEEPEGEDTDEDESIRKDEEIAPPSEDHNKDQETIDYTKRFVFRANSRNELLRNLLSQGIMGHNYIVLPTKDRQTFSIYYKGKRRLGVFKVREVTTRLAAKVAIEKLIRYLHRINKYSEGMHIVEHILLRPQAQDQHGFVLYDDQDTPTLQSYEFGEIDQQRSESDDLINVGVHRDNYRIERDDDGNYIVVLMNNAQKPIARHPEPISNEERAEDKLLDILDYIKSFKRSGMPIFDRIKYTTKNRYESQGSIDKDYYSLTLSVVLPNWPSRFQNSDFRDLMRNIIVLNAPVYVHIDFHWLNSRDMEQFEEVYFDWLKERVAIEPQQPALDDKAQRIMDLLIQRQ